MRKGIPMAVFASLEYSLTLSDFMRMSKVSPLASYQSTLNSGDSIMRKPITFVLGLCFVGLFAATLAASRGHRVPIAYFGATGCESYEVSACTGTDDVCGSSVCNSNGSVCQTGLKDYGDLKNCRMGNYTQGTKCGDSHKEMCTWQFNCTCNDPPFSNGKCTEKSYGTKNEQSVGA